MMISLALHPGRICFLSFSLILAYHANGFVPSTIRHTSHANLSMVIEIGPTEDDINPPLPGQMKISEIKSELDLRSVSYKDCFDRESLENRLNEARSSGKADPCIIDQFNKGNAESNSLEIDEDTLEGALGGDGTLPGGMPPEMLTQLMSDPELVGMLRSAKMQEVMKLVMSGGQEAFEDALKDDKEMLDCVKKLNQIMGKMNEK
jgi:hypothetical protein